MSLFNYLPNPSYKNKLVHLGLSTEIEPNNHAVSSLLTATPILSYEIPASNPSNKHNMLDGKQRRILIIDDEKMIRTLMTDLLQSANFTTDAAEDGQQALNLYKKNPKQYDLIILDMRMPVMDGETFFYKMKELNPNQKVVICSGYSNIENVEGMLKAGALGLLPKPFTLQTFYNEIQKHLS